MNYKKLQKEFDALSETEQWRWALERAKDLVVSLDNDNTTFYFKENPEADFNYFSFKADVGHRGGTKELLNILGFEADFC